MHIRRHTLLLVLILVLFPLASQSGAAIGPSFAAQLNADPQQALEQAWEQARKAGSYRILSSTDQTMLPRAVPEMIGQGDVHLTIENDGTVVLPNRAYVQMSVVSGADKRTATLLHDGNQSFLLQDGEVIPIDDSLSLALPNHDVLGYLAAAEHVTRLPLPEGHPELTALGFELSGERFEAYVRQISEQAYADQLGAPDGLTLQPSPALASLSGQGELWVDQDGYPVREILDIEMPEANQQYGARLHMVVDLSDYGEASALPKAVQGGDGAWHLEGRRATSACAGLAPGASSLLDLAILPAHDQATLRISPDPAVAVDADPSGSSRIDSLLPLRIAPINLVLFVLLSMGILVIRFSRRNPRRCYLLVMSTIIPIMVFSPLLQAGQVVRFVDRQAQAAEARAEAAPAMLQALGLESEREPRLSGPTVAPTMSPSSHTSERDGFSVVGPVSEIENAASRLQSSVAGSELPSRCGEGEPGVDTDGDGLLDRTEFCLGTSPYVEDSDSDGIPDKVELDGFDLGGEHWESDPLNPDSNGDGTLDTLEWSSALTTHGQASNLDLDGDGIPNLWDDDDDGDDLPDSKDLSPFAATDYMDSLRLSTKGEGYDGYQTIALQVQPLDPDHLRYTTTALDWPADDLGNVKDLDDSAEDLRLTPFLLVTTNISPDSDLAESFGYRSWEDDEGQVILMVPLVPVRQGGAVHSFYAKVAYAPGQTEDIQWDAKMVWMAQMQVDRYEGETVVTEGKTLHQYQESFRLAGMEVTKDHGYEAAVLGTPTERDDLDLFRVLLGLGDTFKSHVTLEGQDGDETALQEIAQRFAVESTADLTHTFGVDRPTVAMEGPEQYGHMDAGLAGLGSDLIPNYLATYDAYYGNSRCQDAEGNPVNCASLIVAYEQSTGVLDLADMSVSGNNVVSQMHVNLADIPLLTMRGVQMRMYEELVDGWQMMTSGRMLELVEQRYVGSYETALRDLYPDLETDDVRLMTYSAYLWATSPSYAPISVDGQVLANQSIDEAQLAVDRALDTTLEDQVETAIDYFGLGTGLAAALAEGTTAYVGWALCDAISLDGDWGTMGTGSRAWNGVGVGLSAITTGASMMMSIINVLCDTGAASCRNEDALFVANTVAESLGVLGQAQCLVDLAISAFKGTLDTVSKLSVGIQAVGLVIGVGVTWASFAMTLAFGGMGDPVVWRVALATAIVMTIYLIVIFVITLIPVVGEIISAILSLIDMLLSLFTGLFASETYSIATVVLNLFYDAEVRTSLKSAEFGEFSSGLADGDMGLISGNKIQLTLPASGIIQKEPDGDDDDLRDSYVEGQLTWQHSSYTASERQAMFTPQDMSEARDCQIVDDELRCTNVAKVGYLLTPKINGIVAFAAQHNYQTVWAEVGGYGAWTYKVHKEQGTLPTPENADDLKPNMLYLDVLPAELTGLWTWTALTNLDPDGDGLTFEQEVALGTVSTAWDSDGDGLSDYYEWQTANEHGANPRLADTDGDGLDDDLELRLGTRINVADSDNDGLLDGEEVRHWEHDRLVGGWQITAPDSDTYWVSSDPLQADADSDGLTDAEEKANGLCPNAANEPVPTLSLSATPLRGIHGGRAGTYWQPDEAVEFKVRLSNGAPDAVTTTLTLELPDWLTDLAGGDMEGDRTPVLVRDGSLLSWSFTGPSALQSYEVAETTIGARTTAAAGSQEIALSLPYGGVQMRKSIDVVLDGDDPDMALLAPVDGAYLSGASYVIGGSASDPTTWIAGVVLSIVDQGALADFQPVSGSTDPWSYAWTLPNDGVYALQARATDAMGHTATTEISQVTVDNTNPEVTLDWDLEGSTAHLSGTATDNLSGAAWVRLMLDDQPWKSVPLTDTVWAFDWTMGEDAQGQHDVSVRAGDHCGNKSTIVSGAIVVDHLPPSSTVTSGVDDSEPIAVKPGTTFTLAGVADEGGHLPLPAVSADLRSGMDVFEDSALWLGISTIHDNDGGVLATWIGDMNGDRLSDLAVGLPGPSGDAGRVVVLYGRAGDWPTQPDLEMLEESETRFVGADESRLGSYVAAAGDANGDNYADLLIGARDSNRAFLIFGNPGPLGQVTLDAGQTGYRTLLQAPDTVEGLALAGDVDLDGYDDLLVRAGGTAYLLLGRVGPWPETINVAHEAVATWTSVTGALGVGDVDDDQHAEWVTMSPGAVKLYGWEGDAGADLVETISTADASPRAYALGDVNADDHTDWLYTDGDDRVLVYGDETASHTFVSYDGFSAAPGDVDGDGRADILLANASGEACLIRQQAGEPPEVWATIDGVGGAANAPYSLGADLNADGSSDLVLIPSPDAAEARGFDAPDMSSGFVSPQSLPRGSASVMGPGQAKDGLAAADAGLLYSFISENYYVDDDGLCDGNSPCYSTIQAAVDASDGGGDTITVYPGVYDAFGVPAGANDDNLAIRGVSADAVFVDGDGSDAIQIAADGVSISNLTLRNAENGIVLLDGAGEATVQGGSQTYVDHILAHSVQCPISMSQVSALSLSDSTLVGDGTHAIIHVGSEAGGLYTWHEDRAVPLPVITSTLSITTNGALLEVGESLAAIPGGQSRAVYTSTPGTDGVLGEWSHALDLKHDLPYDTGFATSSGQDAAILLASSGSELAHLNTNTLWPKLGGDMIARGNDLATYVYAVAVSPTTGDVYVGGNFTQIGTLDAFYIARWDGECWHKVGGDEILDNGTNGIVRALAFGDHGNLYVGGDFTQAGTLPVGHVAGWDGSSWFALGDPTETSPGEFDNGVDGPVYALAYDETSEHTGIYIGGDFTWAHNSASHRVVGYNMVQWRTAWPGLDIPEFCQTWGTNGPVYALAVKGNNFYGGNTLCVGGAFTGVRMNMDTGSTETAVSNVAGFTTWNRTWLAMGDGLAGEVIDLATDPTTWDVYAVADSDEAVQCWDGSTWSRVSGLDHSDDRPISLAADTEGNVYVGAHRAWEDDSGARLYVQRQDTTGFVEVGRDPADTGTNFDWIEDLAIDANGQVYAATNHRTNGSGEEPDTSSCALSRWVISGLYQCTASLGSWIPRAYPPTEDGWVAPEAMVGDGSGAFYAVWGSHEDGVLYRLDSGASSWTSCDSPDLTLTLKHLVWAETKLYAAGLTSDDAWRFVCYDPVEDHWQTMAQPPIRDGLDATRGLSWRWDEGDHIYLMPGNGRRYFRRYAISTDSWENLPEFPDSFGLLFGPAMARLGEYLYVYALPADGVTTNLFRYGALSASDLRLAVDRTAFVVPDAASTFAWSSLEDAGGTYRFGTDIDTTNAWVGPSSAVWSPALPGGGVEQTWDQAAFVAPEDGLYRLDAYSTLDAGYHHYVGTAHVYTSRSDCTGCADGSLTWGETAFSTVRQAIDSGAARVLVHPGRYAQSFYLVSGVDVVGSGAETTIIEPPTGTTGTLVTAEGIARASLARMTLAGNGSWQGFLAEGGAQGLSLARNIVRDTSTGVRLRDDSEVEIVNNTIVRNTNGIVIEGTNPVNVRNTILAYNTGTGLEHGASPTSLSNTYNDFYANGTDMSPVDVGGGKLFLSPQFESLAANDFRLADDSRLVDMGAPSDPTPPGAGTRVDIGYAEYNAAGFYVSHDYAETELNDGLTWGVDAFDTVQNALDAAADTLLDLQGALPEGGYTVGVDSGTFTETVSVPSHVNLVGMGAENSVIDPGNASACVFFDGVTDAMVTGFMLQSASSDYGAVNVSNAASGITVSRNVLHDNAGHGVALAGQSSATVGFCTIVGNSGAGVYATDAGTWAHVRNSILDDNAWGLQASSGGLVRNDYNLLHNLVNMDGVTAGKHTTYAEPLFGDAIDYFLSATSPALDAADPLEDVPQAGGIRADLGYRELIASPLTLMFGPEIASTVTANSGVAQVEIGMTQVTDPSQPVTDTLPSSWQTLEPTASSDALFFWSQDVSKSIDGLYRVYSRATDVAHNVEEDEVDWYEGAFVVDSMAPTVSWGEPNLPSSTSAAAVNAVVQADGTLSTGAETRDDLQEVYLRVAGPGGTVVYPVDSVDTWIPLPTTGSYVVDAVAVDEAGNDSETSTTLTVTGSDPVATLIEPLDGSAVQSSTVTLHGYARFGSSGAGLVEISVGGDTVQASIDSPGAAFSGWSAEITLPAGEGSKSFSITPSQGDITGATTSYCLYVDKSASPDLNITSPAEGTCVTQTVTFAGSVFDTMTDVAGVQVSLDGGYTWQSASLIGDAWSLAVDLDGAQDYCSYPAQIRAFDGAGNASVVEWPVAVDSLPPTGLRPVTFGETEGQHLAIGTELYVQWNDPLDAGGPVEVFLSVDQDALTEPDTVVTGTSSSVALDATGEWYVHLAVQDNAGNRETYHNGPWFVRDMADPTFGDRRQSIVVDGVIDLEHDEWREGDLLGTDAQGLQTQQLYTTWDGKAIYLGWSGAWWTLDGAMWAYLDVDAGGSTQSIGGDIELPVAADVALGIDGPEDGSLYTWNGSSWVLSEDENAFAFAHGTSGDSEARLPWSLSADQTVELVAMALPNEDEALCGMHLAASSSSDPWAVFPNTNPLGADPSASYAWDGLNVTKANDGQPGARTVLFSADSLQPSTVIHCPQSTIEYYLRLENPEPTEITGLTLVLTATEGLTYQTVSGATLALGAAGDDHWTLKIPSLASGATHCVTVTGETAADLTGLLTVTSSIALWADDTELTGQTTATVSHGVDGQAPTVSIDALPGLAIAAGQHGFTGSSSDGAGSGVAYVEVRQAGAMTWQRAEGTLAWSAAMTIPDGATNLTLEARAVDACGHTSDVATRTFAVDTTPPVVSWIVPAVVTSTLTLLDGSTFDAEPIGALVASAEVQLDSEQGAWNAAIGPRSPDDGSQTWSWSWFNAEDDGVLHQLRARATDGVGNIALTGWQPTLVDVVAPQITVTARLTHAVVPNDAGVGSGSLSLLATRLAEETALLSGTVTDGSEVLAVNVRVFDPMGASSVQPAILVGATWQFAPDIASWPAGTYGLRIEALDIYGNLCVGGPYLLDVEIEADDAIEGLLATHDGPGLVDASMTLSATISAGTNVTYVWNFGDGATGTGKVTQHVYSQAGDYTATVTATNGVSAEQAATQTSIFWMTVEAGESQEADENDSITVNALIGDARPGQVHTASLDWGDGTQNAGLVDDVTLKVSGSHAYAAGGIYAVTVTVRDEDDHTAVDTLYVTVNAVNDGPENSVPSGFGLDEDTIETGLLFGITDIDAGASEIDFSLAAEHGVLTWTVPSGLVLTDVMSGTRVVTYTGTLTEINAALGSVSYQPDANYDGPDDIRLVSDDLGHNGSGGALVDASVVTVTVHPVNDAPTLDASFASTLTAIDEDTTSPVGDTVGGIVADGSIADVDGSVVEAIAVIGVDDTHGSWQYSTDSGANWFVLDDVAPSAARLLASDSMIRFVPEHDYFGVSELMFRAWDRSSGLSGGTADTTVNGGSTGYSTVTDTASIAVNAVNDGPCVSVPGAFTAVEGVAFPGLVFGVTDVDVATEPIQFNLSANHGTLTLVTVGSLTWVSGADGSHAMSYSGNLNDLNAALDSVGYRSDPNWSGQDTITFTANDLGSIGEGGALTGTDTVTVTVLSTNSSIELAATGDASVFGQKVVFTATVASDAALPTGQIRFCEGSTAWCTATLDSGVAQFSSSCLAVGEHVITATYLGDALCKTCSCSVNHAVARACTSLALATLPDTSLYGTEMLVSASVAAVSPGAGTPTGAVTLREGSVILGTAPLVGGVATWAVSDLAVGDHTLTADYPGDGCFLHSSGEAWHKIDEVWLDLSKTDNKDTWYAGWIWQYTLGVTNTNALPVTGIWLTDVLPVDVVVVDLPDGAMLNDDGSVTWDMGTLDAGASRTFDLSARSYTSVQGPVENVARLTWQGGGPVVVSDTTILKAPPTVGPTPSDLVLHGVVSEGSLALADDSTIVPLVGATVRAYVCGWDAATTSDAAGYYELTLPAAALYGCDRVALEASATGYLPYTRTLSTLMLREQPQQDFCLDANGHALWLPMLMR